MKKILYILALIFAFLAPAAGQQGMLLVGSGGCSGGPNYSPILDTYSGAIMAFDMVRQNSAYNGPCIRARRGLEGGEEQDIYFCSTGHLDTLELLKFSQGGDVRVVRIYDQSGNGNDVFSDGTTPGEPIIVLSGVILRSGGLPAMRCGNNTFLRSSDLNYSNTAVSVFTVAENENTSADRQSIIGQRVHNRPAMYKVTGSVLTYSVGPSNSIDGATLDTSPHVRTVIAYSGGSEAWEDGSSVGTDTSYTLAPYDNIFVFGSLAGASTSNAYGWMGLIQSVLIYDSDERTNRTGIEGTLNDIYNLY